MSRSEHLSPFVSFDAAALEPIELETGGSSWLDKLRDPEEAVRAMLEPRALQTAIAGSILTIALTGAGFGFVIRYDEGFIAALSAASRLAFSMFVAVAAALGPIHATSVLVAARVPFARLVAVLLGAVAAGTVVLAPLAPLVRLAHQRDLHWYGPIGLVVAFGVAAIVAGLSVRALLVGLATASSERALTEAEEFRVGILSRMACLFLGFTVALALWGLGAFA